MRRADPERLLDEGATTVRGGRMTACIEIQLDGTTLRDSDGAEIATLTAAGWIDPDGVRTERVRIPFDAPRAVLSAADAARHQRETDAAWLSDALEIPRAVAGANATFTVDDVWAAIRMPPRDPRAQMSRLMRAGERDSLMRLTGATRPCARNDGGRRVRVWRSLIHAQGAAARQAELGNAP